VGAYFFPQAGVTGIGVREGADFHLFAVRARAAYGWRTGPITFGPLVVAGVEHLAATGFGGTATSFSQEAIWGTVGGGGFIVWSPLRAVAVRATVEGIFSTSRPAFVVLQPPLAPIPVHRVPLGAGRSTIGIEFQFL
jgi:hypothetical protein